MKYYPKPIQLIRLLFRTVIVFSGVACGWCTENLLDLKTRAQSGDIAAQWRLAEIHAKGIGVAKDLTEAEKWCRAAAEAGHATAQYNMGIIHLHGVIGPKDVEKAVIWLKRSAVQKHVPAIVDLGRVYSTEPLVMDEREAIKWYRIGVNLRDIDCMILLADKYEQKQELKEAFLLITQAASSGSVIAKTRLGQMYEKGSGVAVDLSKAAECYRGAALRGDAFAQAFLAKACLFGDGVPRDLVQAAAWMEIAERAEYLPKRMLLIRSYIELSEKQKLECRTAVQELDKFIEPDPSVARAYGRRER